MVVLKCKMCGGNLEIDSQNTVCTCTFCGTQQTVPKVDNEKKIKLFERANKLRYQCEFDKAYTVYESIIEDFPNEAEAYWGLLLCKYGIEYVDDSKTGKKIPTCHRSSFDSVLDEESFEMVMENADSVARGLYRREAIAIEELRKSIIEISSKEEPYDVFICYKETDENGERTIDSVLAQDIYMALKKEGYKVFFSKITLEDKLGVEYEPYIFSALHSAQIMIAVGTTYDHYHAVWVKNEWSRFLKLMEQGENKTLIPCYKDISPYDIPKEFSRLQGQDMNKIGAMQDLVYGVKKVLKQGGKIETTEKLITSHTAHPTVQNYVDRMYDFLDGEDWDNAERYSEKILDIEYNNAEAYLGEFLAEHHVSSLEKLSNLRTVNLNSISYKKLQEYASDELREKIENALQKRLESFYNIAKDLVEKKEYENAIFELDQLADYKDSKVQMKSAKIKYIEQLNATKESVVNDKSYMQKQSNKIKRCDATRVAIIFPIAMLIMGLIFSFGLKNPTIGICLTILGVVLTIALELLIRSVIGGIVKKLDEKFGIDNVSAIQEKIHEFETIIEEITETIEKLTE